MSIEHWIYSPDPPLARDHVAQACGMLGEKSWAVAYVSDLDALVAEERGPLASGCVLGWIPGGTAEAEIRRAVRDRDRAAIDDLYARDLLAIVSLRVATRGGSEWDEVAIGERAAETPAEFRAEVKDAATFYGVESGARRNEITLEFQILFWRAVGVLSNGLMEDPQEGELISTIQEIGRDGERADEALDAMEADREAMLTRRSVLALDDLDAGPRQDRGAMAVDATALVLGGMKVGDLLLHATSLSASRSVPGLVGSLIAIVIAWYFARERDRFGYWMLVAIAGLLLAASLPRLPDASGLEAMLLASRAMAGALALGLLWGPARGYATGDPQAARRG